MGLGSEGPGLSETRGQGGGRPGMDVEAETRFRQEDECVQRPWGRGAGLGRPRSRREGSEAQRLWCQWRGLGSCELGAPDEWTARERCSARRDSCPAWDQASEGHGPVGGARSRPGTGRGVCVKGCGCGAATRGQLCEGPGWAGTGCGLSGSRRVLSTCCVHGTVPRGPLRRPRPRAGPGAPRKPPLSPGGRAGPSGGGTQGEARPPEGSRERGPGQGAISQ